MRSRTPPREGVRGGLRTADEGVGHHLGVQFFVGEGAPPLGDLRIDEVGEQGVVGLLPQPLEDRLEVVLRLDLHLDGPSALLAGLHEAQLLDPGVGPGLDSPAVIRVGAHLDPDHDERQRHGELAHPVARPAVDEVVDQLVGQ